MVAETLLSSVQFAGLKSRFGSMQAGYFNYPPAGSGQPPPRPAPPLGVPDGYPVSPLELPGGMHGDVFNQRKQREFIPDSKKDESYWDRRRRNNEAAKRSREKRRLTDMVLESRVFELTKENHLLRAQLTAIRDKFGIVGENLINRDQVLAQVPAMDQILNLTKRHKALPGNLMLPAGGAAQNGSSFVSAPPSIPPFCEKSPPPAPLPAPPAGLLFRQQSMRELRLPKEEEMAVCDFSRPRSAEPEHMPRPAPLPMPELAPIRAAVNLSSKPTPASTAVSAPAAPPTSPSIDSGAIWPLKLRHKTLLCEREAAATGLLALNQFEQLNEYRLKKLKEEPQDSPTGSEASSGDERDSGLSDRSASSDGTDEPSRKRARSEVNGSPVPPTPEAALPSHQEPQGASGAAAKPGNGQIRNELERLAKEVASLKSMLNQQNGSPPPPHREA